LLRELPELRSVPMVADASQGLPTRRLDVDSITSTAELEVVLLGALRARELMRKEEETRHRLEVLLEITQLACTSRDARALLTRTALRLKEVLPVEQVSVLNL